MALATSAGAAEPLWLFTDDTTDGRQVSYADCGESDRWVECVRMTLACDGDVGSFSITHGAGLAVRIIETDDPAAMSPVFTVGQTALTAEATGINVQPNMVDGGWQVQFPSHDMGALFAAIAERPDANITVSVAGEDFDLTPRPEDRDIMRVFAAKCASK